MDIKKSTSETNRAILSWFNKNREVIKAYRNQYIAYSASGLIAHGQYLDQVLELAQRSGEPC